MNKILELDGIVKKKLNINKNSIENKIEELIQNSVSDSILLDECIEAPDDWNFYGKISANKMQELLESILSIGLMQPIIVWEQEENKYMILSGHNRVRAYKLLRDNENSSRYSRIEAIIKRKNEINENIAKEIIIDTNYVQRELTTMQKAKSISMKYIQLKNKPLRLDINELVANEYNLSKRQIINYRILDKIYGPIGEYIDNGKISIKAGVYISKLSLENQKYLYDKFIINDKCKLLNKKYKQLGKEDLTIEDISSLLTEEAKKQTTVKVKYINTKKEYDYFTLQYNVKDEKVFIKMINNLYKEDIIIKEIIGGNFINEK